MWLLSTPPLHGQSSKALQAVAAGQEGVGETGQLSAAWGCKAVQERRKANIAGLVDTVALWQLQVST